MGGHYHVICLTALFGPSPIIDISIGNVSQQIRVSYRNYAVVRATYVHLARIHIRKIMIYRL